MSAVAVGAILFALLLLIVAAMVWQEMRRFPDPHPTYVVEEAVPFVFDRLSDDAVARLEPDDVRRILEWEVFYLQGLDVPRDHSERPAPVAGSPEAIAFIAKRSAGAGHPYRTEDVAEVLAHEAAYLADIGAVGPPSEGSPS